MRSLFWKGMLAFLAVILVAVGTVALLAGRATETELRRYALVQGEIWTHLISDLSDHYAARGSWEGAENILQAHRGRGQRNQQLLSVPESGTGHHFDSGNHCNRGTALYLRCGSDRSACGRCADLLPGRGPDRDDH